MKLLLILKPIGSSKNPLAFALFIHIYGTYFFILKFHFFLSVNRLAPDDHVIQSNLGGCETEVTFLKLNL